MRKGPRTWKGDRGKTIPPNTPLILDRAAQVTQTRLGRSNVVWTRAVNVAPTAWDPALANTISYVRDAKIGPDKVYPANVQGVNFPDRWMAPRLRWSDQIGEYIYLEPSPRGGTSVLVRYRGVDQAFTPPGTLSPLNAQETHHLDIPQLKADLKLRFQTILGNAANAQGLNANLLNTPENAEHLLRPLRITMVAGYDAAQLASWYTWKEGVITRITDGARHLAESVEHWRASLYHLNPAQVAVTSVELTGSDLHDFGLGAAFVKFIKPLGPPGSKFAAETDFKTVIKPEDRSIEHSLFGTEDTSLASRINDLANLDPADAIGLIRMETHAQYGSLIEFIRGTAAEDIHPPRPPSQAMREAMVFVYLTGLADLHKENVIWDANGKPYMIDADNALNRNRIDLISPPQAEVQSGFSRFNPDTEEQERKRIKTKPQKSSSEIMKALLTTGTGAVPIIDAVKQAFTGKAGRIVPRRTQFWGDKLNLVGQQPDGNPHDVAAGFGSRWAMAKFLAPQIETAPPPEPGLVGEAGTAQAGRFFDIPEEGEQIHDDFNKGQVPYYNYEYDSGHVTHNGEEIWHGQPLTETLETLLTRFPHQRGLTI